MQPSIVLKWPNTLPSSLKTVFFTFARNETSIRREEALDGIYVIRTSEPAYIFHLKMPCV